MAASMRSKNFLKLTSFNSLYNRSIHRCRILRNEDSEVASVAVIDDEYQERKEAEIDAKRDVCRLPPRYEPWLKSRAKLREPIHASDLEIRNLRKEYARLGAQSGLDPSIMWPTVEEIKKLEAWEAEFEPSLQERFRILNEKKQDEADHIKRRTEEVNKNIKDLPRLLKAYNEKQKKKDSLQLAQQEKRTRLLEEAREYFGYDIDPRDPKFQDMVSKREEDEKMAAKKEKRAKRLASKTASL